MATADVAWIDVLPSAKAFLPRLNDAVQPAAKAAGVQAGQSFGSSFGSSSTNAVEKASAQMSTALRKTADAAGAVRIAEEKLEAVRSSSRSTQTQIVTAEEGLAKARRNETGANEALAASTRRVQDAQTQHTTAVRAGSSAMDEGTRRAGVLTSSFGVMRSAVATGFAAFYAASTAVNFIGGAIAASRDLNETINKSTVIFGGNATAVDSWAKGAARSVGLSREAALSAAAGFGNMYTQLGFSADAAAKMSVKTVQMAADLGSFNNLPTADVAEMIAGAFRGEYDSLQRLIPNISDATVKSQAMAMTGKTNAESLTAQEKAAAVLAIVQRDGAAAMGDFARTSGGLANQQKILTAEWDNAKASLGSLLVGPATAFVGWLADAIPKVQAFGTWIGQNVGWLGPLAAAILGVVAAVKIWSGVQIILNAVLAANPILLVVGIIGALIASLITAYQTSETFRNIVNAVFSAVAAAGQWLWNNILFPIFQIWKAEFLAVVTAAQFAWNNILQPTWNAISTAAQWLWNSVLVPAFHGITAAWDAMVAALKWAWDNILNPVWEVIKTAAQVMLVVLGTLVFGPIAVAWELMSTAMKWAWDNILHPMWNAVEVAAHWLWENVLRPIWDAMGVAWRALLAAFQWAWDNILRPTWDAVSTAAGWLWNNILSPIFGAIGASWDALMRGMRSLYDNILHPMWKIFTDAVGSVQRAFETVKAGVETVWNALMDIVATPINFIIEVVFNKGLFTAWNWVVDTLGLPGNWHAPHWDQLSRGAHFADGGTVPGHSPSKTADNIPAMLTANEFVQPVDTHRYYGTDAMEAVRRREATIAYAKGGWVGPQGTTGAQAPRGAYVVDPEIAKWTGNFLQALNAGQAEAVQAAGGKYANPSGLRRYAAGGAIENALAHARSMQGKPYIWGGVGPSGADCSGFQSQITNVLRGRSPYSRVGTTASFPWAGFQNGFGTYTIGNTKNAFNSGVGHMASTLDGHRLESGSGHGPMLDGSALGATASLFGMHGFLPETGGTFVDAGPGGGQADPWYVTLWHNLTGAFDWFKDSIKGVGEMAGRFGDNQFVQMISAIPGKALGGMWDKIKDTIGGLFSASLGIDTGDLHESVRQIFSTYGWGSGAQWSAADSIISHESAWNPKAQNPTSTASGLFQFIDGTWRAYRQNSASQYAHAKDAPAFEQGAAGANYIQSRYGDPAKAWAYWQAHHYYGQGGPVVVPEFHNGGTTAHWNRDHVALMGPDERVFTPRQDDYFRRFVDAVESGGGGGDKRMLAEQIHVHGGDTDDVINRLWHKVRVADRGGVYTFTA